MGRLLPSFEINLSSSAKAFSTDFGTLLKIACLIKEWEQEKNSEDFGGEFLFYWYAGNGDSPLDDPNQIIEYKMGRVQNGRTSVNISIHTPGWLPCGPAYHRFTMFLVYENDAWLSIS